MKDVIILCIVLVVVAVILWVVWSIVKSIMEQTNRYLEEKQIQVSSTRASFSVNAVPREQIVDMAQRMTERAWRNSVSVDSNDLPLAPEKVPRMMRLKEWQDRKRKVYAGTATQAANEGFYRTDSALSEQ